VPWAHSRRPTGLTPPCSFKSAAESNELLTKLLALVVQNRFSMRRASVMAYVTNQLTQTLAPLARETARDETQVGATRS
jgi:hypothetical protein